MLPEIRNLRKITDDHSRKLFPCQGVRLLDFAKRTDVIAPAAQILQLIHFCFKTFVKASLFAQPVQNLTGFLGSAEVHQSLGDILFGILSLASQFQLAAILRERFIPFLFFSQELGQSLMERWLVGRNEKGLAVQILGVGKAVLLLGSVCGSKQVIGGKQKGFLTLRFQVAPRVMNSEELRIQVAGSRIIATRERQLSKIVNCDSVIRVYR